MKVLSFLLENFMRVRVVEIRPVGRITTISGRNGQGKTSTLQGFFATLQGKYSTPGQPVRKGAKQAKGSILLGADDGDQLLIERTINPDRETVLTLRPARNGRATGEAIRNPQAEINKMFGEMARDPLEFIGMKPKEQIEILRQSVKLDVDLDALKTENERDFEERRQVNVEVKRLRAQLDAMVVQDGLPKDKLDEEGIRAKLNGAAEENKAIERLRAQKAQLGNKARDAQYAAKRAEGDIAQQKQMIKEMEASLASAKDTLISFEKEFVDRVEAFRVADEAHTAAAEPQFVNVQGLVAELNDAQLANREIDKRVRRDALEEQVRGFERDSSSLTRAMEDRTERKERAMREARMPVEGLSFDEDQVMFKGIPLEQLGEAEQLRVSAQIMMAGNPVLRVLPIWRGEALDEANIEMLRTIAEEQDFDVWMVKVDASGNTGIVIEDGEVAKVNR